MTTLTDRWETRELVGANQHALVVRVRLGYFARGYLAADRIDTGEPIVPPLIYQGVNHDCWKAVWTPTTDWMTVPEVQQAQWTRSFVQNGSSTMTFTMDNVAFEDTEGDGGLYHVIKRGHFSPMQGVTVLSRPAVWTDPSPWANVLNGGCQVELWEGYGTGAEVVPLATPVSQVIDGVTMMSCSPGDAIARTWTGLIEDAHLESHPDQIAVTARDFGVAITDQRLVGDNHAHEIVSPVIFGDRKASLGEEKVPLYSTYYDGGSTEAVGEGTIYQVSDVPVSNNHYDLVSGAHDHATDHWWAQFKLNGYTEELLLAPVPSGYVKDASGLYEAVSSFEAWISVYVGGPADWPFSWAETDLNDGTQQKQGPMMDGAVPLTAGAWVDLGLGSTPDGIPYVRHFPTLPGPPGVYELGHGLDLPFGSRLRVTITNLNLNPNPGQPLDAGFYAGLYTFAALVYGHGGADDAAAPVYDPNGSGVEGNPFGGTGVNPYHWVLVEDASDVVVMLLIWAGFPEWDVEPFGWSLYQPLQFGEDKFFQDVMSQILDQGNFTFVMGAPTADDRSIGVPHFNYQRALNAPPPDMVEVTHEDLLETAQVEWNLASLPDEIRYRGNPTPDGATFDEDLVACFQAVYYPPWSSQRAAQIVGDLTTPQRTAGIRRNFLQSVGVGVAIGLNSNEECAFACVLAAIQYALAMCTGQFQIPGRPDIDLNDQVSLIDMGTALNSRMWVASVQSTHKMGPQGSWEMVIGGSYVDMSDFDAIRADYGLYYTKYVIQQGPGHTLPAPPSTYNLDNLTIDDMTVPSYGDRPWSYYWNS
jgi:hypothetical protein